MTPSDHEFGWEGDDHPFAWKTSFKAASAPYPGRTIDGAKKKAPSLANAVDLSDDIDELPPYYIGPAIREGDAALFVAQPGVGKSTLVADLVTAQYDPNSPKALAGAWKIRQKRVWGRTLIINGENSDHEAWVRFIMGAIISRGMSPFDKVGRRIRDKFSWIDSADPEIALGLDDRFRAQRMEDLANLIALEFSTVIMDPILAAFGAKEYGDLGWVFNGLNPFLKRLKVLNVTALLISHPSGAAETRQATTEQKFSPAGSKQQLALIDAHFGIKRDADDRICMCRMKSRRADWILRKDYLKLTKGSPAGYTLNEGAIKWSHQPISGLPLPDRVVKFLKETPATDQEFGNPPDMDRHMIIDVRDNWLVPYKLVVATQDLAARGKPWRYRWTSAGLLERKRLG